MGKSLTFHFGVNTLSYLKMNLDIAVERAVRTIEMDLTYTDTAVLPFSIYFLTITYGNKYEKGLFCWEKN